MSVTSVSDYSKHLLSTWLEFAAQPISIRKAQSRKKSPQTFAHLVNFPKNLSVMFVNRTILLFWLWNEQTFRMFSLRDLRFALCSRDLDVLRAQRIMGFFYLNYPQIEEAEKSNHMDVILQNPVL